MRYKAILSDFNTNGRVEKHGLISYLKESYKLLFLKGLQTKC